MCYNGYYPKHQISIIIKKFHIPSLVFHMEGYIYNLIKEVFIRSVK
jgi:hypothetical protein